LSDRDVKESPPVTVINETMARKYFPKEDPIGKRILVQEIVPGKPQLGREIPWEIVGVMAEEIVSNLDDKTDNPRMYVTNEQSPAYFPACWSAPPWIYGVISYSVVQRTHELGIRTALGASTGNIVVLVLRNGMLMTGIGLALGLAGTLGLSRLLSSLLFGAGERDPMTIAAVAVSRCSGVTGVSDTCPSRNQGRPRDRLAL